MTSSAPCSLQMQQAPIIFSPGSTNSDQVFVFIPTQTQRRPAERWSRRCAKTIGIIHILISTVVFGCDIGLSCFGDHSVNVGFWAGAPVFVTGVLMTVSGFRPTRCLIVSVLIMSIIASVFDPALITFGSMRLADFRFQNGMHADVNTAIGAVYVIVGIVGFGLLQASSILSCVSLCSRFSADRSVAYIPQAMVIGQDGTVAHPLLRDQLLKLQSTSSNWTPPPDNLSDAPPPYSP